MGLLSFFKKKSKSEPISDTLNSPEQQVVDLPSELERVEESSRYSTKQAEEDFEQFTTLDDRPLGQLSSIRFKDGVGATLKNVSIRDTYMGLLEGSPVYASRRYWVDLKNEFEEKGSLLIEPTLVRSCFNDGYCLPSVKVVASFEAIGLKSLSICFFTNEYPLECSLKEFIEHVTLGIDFEANCVEWEP